LDVIAGGDATGGNDTYLGYQAGYHSTTASANVSVGSGSGAFLRTTYIIDPNVDYQFTLRRSADINCSYALFKFGDYMGSREQQTGPAHFHFLKSADGVNWTTWFSITGDFIHCKGYCCVEFLNKLYINWYNSGSYPRLQIWDGNTVTTAFTSVSQNNALAGPMIVSGAKLWILTDVTPYYETHRRVAYWTADGTTYNAVTDYDGDGYLTYNSVYPPMNAGADYLGRFLCNRWLEFKNTLYLFTSTYNTTNSSWSWQVWQAGTTEFTKIYDSSILNDDYCISSVVANDDFVIVTGNTTETGGNYEDVCRVYRSTDLTNWSIIATLSDQGLCFESIEYGNIFYSMFAIQTSPDEYVKIYYWDDENSEFVQCDSTITTNDYPTSGNLIEYMGSLFIGKFKEIYELTRVKSLTVTVTPETASGNTIVGASAGDAPISGSLNCLYGYNSNLSLPGVENGIAIGAYSRVSRDNTLVLGGTGDYQVDVAIGQTYAIGRLHVHQYGEKESDSYGAYIENIATNTAFDGINKYGLYVVSTGAFTGSTGTGTNNYGFYLPAVTGADTNYGFYSVSNITTEDQFISSLADGTPPFVVTSLTEIPNLNAHLLQGHHASDFLESVTAHDILSATHGDTTVGTVLRGDIITGQTATPKWVRLAKGTDGYFFKAGATDVGWAAHGLTYSDVGASASGHTHAYEPALPVCNNTGYVLSSTDAQVRSWIAAGGALALDDLTDVDATSPSDHDIIQYHDGVGWVHGGLPAGETHDILSATHGDTTADGAERGDIIIGSTATPKWTRLAKGTVTHVLTMGADEPGWAAPSGGGDFLICQVFS